LTLEEESQYQKKTPKFLLNSHSLSEYENIKAYSYFKIILLSLKEKESVVFDKF